MRLYGTVLARPVWHGAGPCDHGSHALLHRGGVSACPVLHQGDATLVAPWGHSTTVCSKLKAV